MVDKIATLFSVWFLVGCVVVMGYAVLHPTFQFSGNRQLLLSIITWPWFLYQVGYVGPVPLIRY